MAKIKCVAIVGRATSNYNGRLNYGTTWQDYTREAASHPGAIPYFMMRVPPGYHFLCRAWGRGFRTYHITIRHDYDRCTAVNVVSAMRERISNEDIRRAIAEYGE